MGGGLKDSRRVISYLFCLLETKMAPVVLVLGLGLGLFFCVIHGGSGLVSSLVCLSDAMELFFSSSFVVTTSVRFNCLGSGFWIISFFCLFCALEREESDGFLCAWYLALIFYLLIFLVFVIPGGLLALFGDRLCSGS